MAEKPAKYKAEIQQVSEPLHSLFPKLHTKGATATNQAE